MKKRVLITREIRPEASDLLTKEGYEVLVNNLDRQLSYGELLKKAQNVDAVISMLGDKIDEHFLKQNSHLKVISNYAVGFNNVDIKTASALKIKIGNTPDVLTEATAEIAFGLMIASARNFRIGANKVHSGEWKDWTPKNDLGQSLFGKTVGVVGFGRIGKRFAEMSQGAFKMKVLYTARSEKENTLGAKRVELETLLKESDVISLHVPLSNETRKLIGEKELKLMKSSAVLINTARGEIIDQDALINALEKKIIFGAGLDVTDPEPLPMNSKLHQLDNVFVLPHIGSATFTARSEMAILCAKNIIAGLEGRDLPAFVNKADFLCLPNS